MTKGVTRPPGAAKHAFELREGLEPKDTVPAIWPGAGGVLKLTVVLTVASKGEPSSADELSSEPVDEPVASVGRKVATKLPVELEVVVLQADASPLVTYVPVIVGISTEESPGMGVVALYVPV